LSEKPAVVALNKADALTPEQLKQQAARLKRAAKATPLVVSAATGAGVPEVLRALVGGGRQDALRERGQGSGSGVAAVASTPRPLRPVRNASSVPSLL